VPANDATVYVLLLYEVDGTLQSTNYTYSATESVATVLATRTPCTMPGANKLTLTWMPGTGVTAHALWLDTAGVGSSNMYTLCHFTATSAACTIAYIFPVATFVHVLKTSPAADVVDKDCAEVSAPALNR
jgi:hypothetical protein